MIINKKDARYITAVIEAKDRLTGHTTDRCPECNKLITYFETGDHVVIETDDSTVAVVIACEGYWCIDPVLVGLPRGQWMPPDADEPFMTDTTPAGNPGT